MKSVLLCLLNSVSTQAYLITLPTHFPISINNETDKVGSIVSVILIAFSTLIASALVSNKTVKD